MKKIILLTIFLLTNGCYTDYSSIYRPVESLPNPLKGHTYEVKNYESSKIYSHFSTFSPSDAKNTATIKCQEDNTNPNDCLDYSYTKEGQYGPIERVSYWENSKNNYLKIKNSVNKNDYTKITEWTSIYDNEESLKVSKSEKIDKEKTKKKKLAKVADKNNIQKKKVLENNNLQENIDNKAPLINLKSEYEFKNANYTLIGTVSDESENVYIDIDGRIIKADKGKFKINRFSPVDEELLISATDQWGNKSETKKIKIKISIDEKLITKKLDPLNPSLIENKQNNNRVAVIIGIEKY